MTCSSCNGLNTSCPKGCGRDPKTGELDGSTWDEAKFRSEQRKRWGYSLYDYCDLFGREHG